MSKLILIVDDSEAITKLVSMNLMKAGYQTLTAENGDVARNLFQETQPDLVIVDLMMPIVDGMEFLAWMRSQEEGKTLPAILLTAVAKENLPKEISANLAHEILRKPIKIPELIEAIHRNLT